VLGVSGDSVRVATADGAIAIKRVRPQGGGKVAVSDWVSEAGVKQGDKLGG
jgi:methionyl-tRNA formyltransferase